jgi:hypothetical protein
MKVDERLLRRLVSLAAVVVLAWPTGTGTGLPTDPGPSCPPGSDVGIDDFVAWVDGAGGSDADIPIRSALACANTRTITFQTYDITAKAGADYVGVSSGTVTLTGGVTYTTVRIRILAKPSPGPDVTFGVRLTSGARFSDPESTVTIKSR